MFSYVYGPLLWTPHYGHRNKCWPTTETIIPKLSQAYHHCNMGLTQILQLSRNASTTNLMHVTAI